DEPVDDRIKRKLVAAGVDTELERLRQTKLANGERDDAQVFVEFLFKLREVADVIDAFVKPARELRRDGLRRDALAGDHGEDQKKLGGRLRRVGLIHGD